MNISKKNLFKVSAKTNGRCFYCNKLAEEIDHFVSESKWIEWDLENSPIAGELNSLENLFPVCLTCNRKKSNKCPEDFMEHWTTAWDRYLRANKRVGLLKEFSVNLFVYGKM